MATRSEIGTDRSPVLDVAVVGSLHLDIMIEAPRLPQSDETVVGRAWGFKCGGKGGNQAVAAARLGARTGMGGRIGADDFGGRLRANLKAAGVDERWVEVDPQAGSGMSVAILEERGDYGAVIVSGANLRIDPECMAKGWADLWIAPVVLLQNEIPEPVNLAAARAARACGARIVLNAAPARPLSFELADFVDVLVVNRVEAGALAGRAVSSVGEAIGAAKALQRAGQDLIVTLGAGGLIVVPTDGAMQHLPALPVAVVSTHGAGDCFCGALAARLAHGENLLDSCRFAATAAALLVSLPEAERGTLNEGAVRAALASAPAWQPLG